MVRWMFIVFVAMLVAGAAVAQPADDAAWLVVRAVYDDGTQLSTAPNVRVRLPGQPLDAGYERPTIEGNASVFYGMVTGNFELDIIIPGTGQRFSGVPITVHAGANVFDFALPHATALKGAILPAAPGALPTQMLAFLGARYVSRFATAKVTPEGYEVQGVPSGSSDALLLTDAGYAVISFTMPNDQTKDVEMPANLQAGGQIAFTVTAPDATPLANAQVRLSCRLFGNLPVDISLATDANGKLTTLALPPGTWSWSVRGATRVASSGLATVTAGATVEVDTAVIARAARPVAQ